MHLDRFKQYIARFNQEDPGAFEEFLAPDVMVVNGTLELPGRSEMARHYTDLIWPNFVETLSVLRFVSDESTAAVQMWTRFAARRAATTLFGDVLAGEIFDYRGVIMYEIGPDQRFHRITVAYNSFINTKPDGQVVNMGLPH